MNRYESDVLNTRAALMKKQEDRSNAANEALNSIRSAKVTGNAKIQASIVERLRVEEARARQSHDYALRASHLLGKYPNIFVYYH